MSARKFLKRNILILLLFVYGISYAQPVDDTPTDPGIKVTKAQDMNFGAFSVTGSGGTITLTHNGQRSATGGVVLLSMGYLFYPAIFEIEAPVGTIVSVTNGPDVSLTGSNGGSATLQLGASSPASPFTTTVEPPSRTPVYIGGTLTMGSSSPPGTYSGTFSVTFNYQ